MSDPAATSAALSAGVGVGSSGASGPFARCAAGAAGIGRVVRPTPRGAEKTIPYPVAGELFRPPSC